MVYDRTGKLTAETVCVVGTCERERSVVRPFVGDHLIAGEVVRLHENDVSRPLKKQLPLLARGLGTCHSCGYSYEPERERDAGE
jgi:hypothetical protein